MSDPELRTVLVINSGSSSMKYQLRRLGTGECVASGTIERIGLASGRITHQWGDSRSTVETRVADHRAAFAEMVRACERTGGAPEQWGIAAVGHRVVQGGAEFSQPTVIDDAVQARILALAELAPLHNPANVAAIAAARELFSGVPHVAVFDTAFHHTMPEAAYSYAIDAAVAKRYGVRRYGFHGTSHQYVSRRAAEFLGRPLEQTRQVVMHLGNGASVCAVSGGVSVNTSMGMTPLQGLVMGTRSGDIDPGALLHLLRAGYSVDDLDELLNHRSGLRGLSGLSDYRDVRAAADAGDAAAQLALDVFVQRIREYLGAYLVQLGGADALVFTAGVGENAAAVRSAVCADLAWCGVRVDEARNLVVSSLPRLVSADDSQVAVLVVPTDEEAEIAAQTWSLLAAEANVSGAG